MGLEPSIDETFTILPPPRSRMAAMASIIMK